MGRENAATLEPGDNGTPLGAGTGTGDNLMRYVYCEPRTFIPSPTCGAMSKVSASGTEKPLRLAAEPGLTLRSYIDRPPQIISFKNPDSSTVVRPAEPQEVKTQ